MIAKISLLLFLFISCNSIAQESAAFAPQSIYDADTVVWFGADFTFFKLTDPRKVNEDDKLLEYVFAWNEEYKYGLSNVKLASLLEKKKVINDKEFTDAITNDFKVKPWIQSERNTISIEEIQLHLNDIESSNKGLGLIYIIENFYKDLPAELNGYFVWFDIETKKAIHFYQSSGYPNNDYYSASYLSNSASKRMPKSKGMTGYWYRGMIDATVEFTVEYKKGIKRQEKQY